MNICPNTGKVCEKTACDCLFSQQYEHRTSAQPSKPDFKAFKEWAEAAGYDTAHTHYGVKWVYLNPMTADLWKAWQAAHGIKEHQ